MYWVKPQRQRQSAPSSGNPTIIPTTYDEGTILLTLMTTTASLPQPNRRSCGRVKQTHFHSHHNCWGPRPIISFCSVGRRHCKSPEHKTLHKHCHIKQIPGLATHDYVGFFLLAWFCGARHRLQRGFISGILVGTDRIVIPCVEFLPPLALAT